MKHLKAHVIHEYGMAEAGAIAYSYEETENIRVFWDSFIILVDENGKLFLTTLSDKVFPLFHYDSEDRVSVREVYKETVLSLCFIEGKFRDILNIPSIEGETLTISTIFFDHVLKYFPGIYSVQYRQLPDGVGIVLNSDRTLDLIALKKYMVLESKKEFNNINFDKITLSQGESSKTIAGKHKVMID
ncbi:MAG: hypothetical protein HQK84_09670 [Nitrospinae bacterium]|nr:hypothetical protein [Nitrospinota bacterium]